MSIKPEQTIVFKFLPGQDMFYIPWADNEMELNRLYLLVDQHYVGIVNAEIPIHVDGYCISLPTRKENLNTAFVRANRVKSELITHKGLLEAHFVTNNHAKAYEGEKDMVVVTLRIPAKKEPEPERVIKQLQTEETVVEEEKPKPIVEQQPIPEPVIAEPVVKEQATYCFAVRTNLLYDAFLLPTLGVEWRLSPAIGVKVDGSRSWWGDRHGKVQKIWLVNPEVRYYLLQGKRVYMGASAAFGEYNVYKYMIGSLFSDDTGYQGKLWNAGLTVGYQLYLSCGFLLDFNLGLGYNCFDYDSFIITNKTRTYKDINKTKNCWGPTQAGISLVWTF